MPIDDPFNWGAIATSLGQSHAPSRPGDAVIGNGYPDGFPLPADQFNWVAYMVGLAWARVHAYATLEDAVDGMTVGDMAWVDEHDLHQEPGGTHTGVVLAGTHISVDCTGDSVVHAKSTAPQTVYVKSRDLVTTIATITPSNAGTLVRAVSDGVIVVAIYGTWVEAFNHNTGASIWSFNHGANLLDVAIDATNAYIVGVAAGGFELHAIALTSVGAAAPTWSYNHNGTLASVATNGRQVFVAGAASGHASLANARAIRASDGADLANEGGLGAAGTRSVWDKVLIQSIGTGQRIATDGDIVVYGFSTGVAHQVEVRGCATGDDLSADLSKIKALAGTYSVASVAIDQDRIYIATDDGGVPSEGYVRAYDKRTLADHWTWNDPDGVANNLCRSVCSDGTAVFATKYEAGDTMARIYRGNRPGPWRRVTPSTQPYLPMRQQIIPWSR